MGRPNAAALLAAVLSCVAPARGWSQEAPMVAEGARVRVSLKSPGPRYYDGTIVAVRPDTLVLTPERRADTVRVAVRTIRKLVVNQGPGPAWRGALKGAKIGLSVAAAAGLALVLASDCADFSFDWSHPSTRQCTSGEQTAIAAVLIGVPVAATIIGAARPGDHWVNIPVKRLRASLGARGIGLTISL